MPEDKLKRILEVYRRENVNFIGDLEKCLSEGDFMNAEKMVHKLKSSTGGIGANTLYKQLITFQAQLKDGDDSLIKLSFEQIKLAMHQLLNEVDIIIHDDHSPESE
jgi:HPt (histidine-containing phosphotransfer) domain-containing protein